MTTLDRQSAGSPLSPLWWCAALTCTLLAIAVFALDDRYGDLADVDTSASRLAGLEGEILRLDDSLALSARLAAATGDLRWERRYRDDDLALAEALRAAAAAAGAHLPAIPDADEARITATERERDALELVRWDKLGAAGTRLDTNYDELQQRARRGRRDELAGLDGAIAERRAVHHRSMIAVIGALAISGALLIGLWIRAVAMIRRHLWERGAAEEQLRIAGVALAAQIADRSCELVARREQVRFIAEHAEAIAFEWDREAREMVYLAPRASTVFGWPSPELLGSGFLARVIRPDERDRLAHRIERFLTSDGGALDCKLTTASGKSVQIRMVLGTRRATHTAHGVLIELDPG